MQIANSIVWLVKHCMQFHLNSEKPHVPMEAIIIIFSLYTQIVLQVKKTPNKHFQKPFLQKWQEHRRCTVIYKHDFHIALRELLANTCHCR